MLLPISKPKLFHSAFGGEANSIAVPSRSVALGSTTTERSDVAHADRLRTRRAPGVDSGRHWRDRWDPTPEERERVGEAARRLVELRDGWLNPPGLDPADLAKRTLTNLYNQRPTWLANAHASLDAAVFAAYGWPANIPDTEILEGLLDRNQGSTTANEGRE